MKSFNLKYSHFTSLYLILLLFVGCDIANQNQHQSESSEIDTAEIVEQSLSFYDGKPYRDLSIVSKVERLKNELSEIYSGFAGLYISNETNELVLALVIKADFEKQEETVVNKLESKVSERFQENDLEVPDYSFKTKYVANTFRELQQVRDIIVPVLQERDDVVEAYIDVKNNVFKIGIVKGTDKRVYNDLIESFSIESGMVQLYETERVQFTTDLRDKLRPVRGGLEIYRSGATCTFGFNIKLNGTDMWVTNSHCTQNFSSTGNTLFYQDTYSGSNTFLGEEYRDYQGSYNWRFSDAVIIDHSGGETRELGGILATEYPGISWGNFGSIDLIPDGNDFIQFKIVSELYPVIPGMNLQKIGKRTGWTIGEVKDDCRIMFDVQDNWDLHCQLVTDIYVRGGDSGSPVFYAEELDSDDEPAALVGITWGRNTVLHRTYHSYVDAIREDLLQSGETMTTY